MVLHRSWCSVPTALLFSSSLLLGVSSCSDSQDDVVHPKAEDVTPVSTGRSQENSNKNHGSVAGTPSLPAENGRIFLTLPFVEPDGVPIVAILDDSNHGVDIGPFFPNTPKDYQQEFEPVLALWPNGKVIWRSDNRQYYQSRISTDAVKELVSSIRIEDYNTTDNMQYSYWGGQLVDEYFTILYVSKGTGDNIILYSPFHFWKPQGTYHSWGHSIFSAESYQADKCSWPQFCEKVPRSFISYLAAWESLQSKLLPLTPDPTASERIDLMEDIRQITYLYEFKKPTRGWVRIPKERCPIPFEDGESRVRP